MDVKRLKEILSGLDDDTEVFVRNSANPVGNIQGLDQVEMSTYGFFGKSLPCVIFNTGSSKEIEENEQGDILDFISEK